MSYDMFTDTTAARRSYAWGEEFRNTAVPSHPGDLATKQSSSGPFERAFASSSSIRISSSQSFNVPQGNNSLPGGPDSRISPFRRDNSQPTRSGSLTGGDKGWGQLKSNSPFQRHPSKIQTSSPKPPSHSSLPFKPIVRSPNREANVREARPRGESDFWNELDSRVGRSAPRIDKTRQTDRPNQILGTSRSDDGHHLHRRRISPRSTEGLVQKGQDKRPWEDRDGSDRRKPGGDDEEVRQWPPPALDIGASAKAAYSSNYEPPNIFDQSRRGRKEKTKPDKTKVKQSRVRRRSREMHDDDDEDFEEDPHYARRRKEEKQRRREEKLAAMGPIPILLPHFISIANLGSALGIEKRVFLQNLAELGFEDITLETVMAGETAALVAQEYGYNPTVESGDTIDLKRRPPPEDLSVLPERPPIVTIMGHVDHGKTTMLDWLRRSSVAAQEHGGITQHIGAFSVKLSGGKQITFLDTPGHAAFLTMRQRGANVTDIVILVVAADDSVKPQTLESLKHARAANVPVIVAINKIDKDEARIDQVKADLARNGIEIEDYGGDVQVACVSGRTGEGMDSLEENILTLSEILDLRAERDGMAEGWVLESSVKPVGRAATVLVKRGTLRKGDFIAAGTVWAKIRMLRNEAGDEIDEASPGTPVEILGWRALPDAGDEVIQAPNETRVRDAMDYRVEVQGYEKAAAEQEVQERKDKERDEQDEAAAREKAATAPANRKKKIRQGGTGTGVEDSATLGDSTGLVKVNFTVKGDTMGSVEAVCAAISEIGNNEVQAAILRSAPGTVTEYDVEHAAVTKGTVVNFNTPLTPLIKKMAEDAGVAILDHSVIYHLVDEVKEMLSSKLPMLVTSKVLGEAEVLQVFPINIRGKEYKNIAGCRVRNGQLTRNAAYRLTRNNKTIYDGKLVSLKIGKKDVDEMRKGGECGLMFEGFDELEIGDKIQAYEEIREKRRL
ncbi:translation initiation factor IF-2 [Sporothrix epigloea]|uniref:Translation initiation factor IF-2, mitochondrial n=1 Tax=Sporothrix epigloea TaxID=1892477 RepID=A0ABP0DEQ9_9PEZI